MINIQNLTYTHPNKDLLFDNVNLSINRQDKVALIGSNGSGKSILLRLIAGELQPSSGFIKTEATPYFIPQIFGQFNDLTLAQALRVEDKLLALNAILDGQVTEENLTLLNDDWTVEDRCQDALQYWGLGDLDISQKLSTLSGGQKTKVFLSGLLIHQPEVILLDEPSNHLDAAGRQLLYNFIQATASTMLVVSHDRTLLNLLDSVCELSRRGIAVYGGNYAFYQEQKRIESNALHEDIRSKEKALRKAREVERETAERQQKLDARGRKKQEKAGLPTIMMNTLKNNAEKSTSKLKGVHAEKVGNMAQELTDLRKELPGVDKMKFDFDNSSLHKGKPLITATSINYGYVGGLLWQQPLTFQITSGERVALGGLNGSGKTTLIKIILGELQPLVGAISTADLKSVYIDQDYSLIDNRLTVFEQAQHFNQAALQEHEIKIRLNRFLFTKETWQKPCSILSGGERMRLLLCCLTIGHKAPDIIILDEPTNNLDIQNIEILTAAINDYEGTVLAVSHDQYFLDQIQVGQVYTLS